MGFFSDALGLSSPTRQESIKTPEAPNGVPQPTEENPMASEQVIAEQAPAAAPTPVDGTSPKQISSVETDTHPVSPVAEAPVLQSTEAPISPVEVAPIPVTTVSVEGNPGSIPDVSIPEAQQATGPEVTAPAASLENPIPPTVETSSAISPESPATPVITETPSVPVGSVEELVSTPGSMPGEASVPSMTVVSTPVASSPEITSPSTPPVEGVAPTEPTSVTEPQSPAAVFLNPDGSIKQNHTEVPDPGPNITAGIDATLPSSVAVESQSVMGIGTPETPGADSQPAEMYVGANEVSGDQESTKKPERADYEKTLARLRDDLVANEDEHTHLVTSIAAIEEKLAA